MIQKHGPDGSWLKAGEHRITLLEGGSQVVLDLPDPVEGLSPGTRVAASSAVDDSIGIFSMTQDPDISSK